MGRSPEWKIYDAEGDYRGAVKFTEDAAALAAVLGSGATVRLGHRFIVWTDGSETFSAADSYDGAGALMVERVDAKLRETIARRAEVRS